MKREWLHRTEVRKAGGRWAWACKFPECPRGGGEEDFGAALSKAVAHAFVGGYRNTRGDE